MNSVLFAKMDQVFSKENKTLKKYWKIGKKILEKSGNFVSPEKWEPCAKTLLLHPCTTRPSHLVKLPLPNILPLITNA